MPVYKISSRNLELDRPLRTAAENRGMTIMIWGMAMAMTKLFLMAALPLKTFRAST